MKSAITYLILGLLSLNTYAGNSNYDAALGGALGGAAGAVVGNELGGRDGAIIGGAVGAAIGTTVTTDQDRHHVSPQRAPYYGEPAPYYQPRQPYSSYPRSGNINSHCPPGQAKKGRC